MCCIYIGFEVVVFVTGMLVDLSLAIKQVTFCCNYAVRSFSSTYTGDSFCSKDVIDSFCCNYADGSFCCNYAAGIFISALCL